MKLGVSTYSLSRAIRAGEMTPMDAIGAIAEMGGEHAEIVPIGFNLHENPELIEAIRGKAAEVGIELSGYAVGANFADLDDEAFEREIERVKGEVDIARALGVKRMRHDVASSADRSMRNFLAQLSRLAEACRRIADYAAPFGIVTSVENHGYFVQSSDRVQAVVDAVGRDNFRTTVDTGNFLCVDEDPVAAVRRNLPFASMVHLKDFYVRPASFGPCEGWFPTAGGCWLRGAIVGHGDIDVREVLRAIRQSGYDGFVSIEFEGMEDCRTGVRLGLEYARKVWSELEERSAT